MELQLTDEQGMLADSVRELLRRRAGEDGLVAADSGGPLWQELVDFGALEIGPANEGLGTVDLCLVARELGERLASVPLVDTAALLLAVGTELDGVAVTAAALCLDEPGRSFGPSEPSTRLEEGRLAGTKASVVLADTAAFLAVPAGSPDGITLALVRPGGPGVELEREPTLDRSLRPATVSLDGAVAARELSGSSAAEIVDRLAATAAVLAAAEAVGAAAAVLALARDYAAERRQFGHPIGSFQAVRHLLADMVVLTESSWSSVLYAAASLDEREPDSLETASIAKAWSSRATLDVAHGALQVFGGVAFTAEHRAHLYLRRIASLGARYGSAADHERLLGHSIARQLEVPDMSKATFLPAYLAALDTTPLDVLPMLAPGFAFTVLWNDEDGAKEFSGGLEEFHRYLAQRKSDGHLHHVVDSSRNGALEVVLGRTTRHGETLATFTFAAQVDGEGRAERLFAARTTALPLAWPA